MTVIARFGSALNRWSRRWVPDPFVLALFLTLVVMLLGLWRATAEPRSGSSPSWTVLEGWIGTGGMMSPGGLAFALQMCLILVTGHALALSPAVQRFIRWVAHRPRSAASATMLVALVSCAAAVIHWGLGAIAGALLAREIGRHAVRRGLALHYPLLGAAGYSGFAVWHGGLTGSAPTLVAKNEHFAADLVGTVPMSETVFSPLNLIITGVLIALIVLMFRLLVPRDPGDFVAPDLDALDRLAPLPERKAGEVHSPVHWLQESWMVGALVGTLGSLFVVGSMISGALSWTLDTVVLLFLFLSMALQGSVRHYVEAIADGARGAAGIVLQFPFYFGILGVMKATAMVEWISSGLVELSSRATFPVVAYISAGLVNMFVPSGGGQWAVQGDILLEAGNELGVDPSVTIMAFSYGDAWSNMLQPFWALPLLGIMGLRARDIIGYTTMIFLMMAVVVPILLLILG